MELIKHLLALNEAPDFKSMKKRAVVGSLDDAQKVEASGDIVMNVYYAGRHSLSGKEEKEQLSTLNRAAKTFKGEVTRTGFATFVVKGSVDSDSLKTFFERYSDEVHDPVFGGDTSDGFFWEFAIYQKDGKINESVGSVKDKVVAAIKRSLNVAHAELHDVSGGGKVIQWAVVYEFPEHGEGIEDEIRALLKGVGSVSFEMIDPEDVPGGEFVYQGDITLKTEMSDDESDELEHALEALKD